MSAPAIGQGSNSVQVRLFNERVILTALRRMGEASKADLARYARLTNNTAGQIVKDLVAERLITTGGKRVNGSRGQPATMLTLNPDGAYAIGLEIGRHALQALLVDFAGRIVDRRRVVTSFPLPEEAFGFARDALGELLAGVRGADASRLAGLGVAIPFNLGSWQRELGIDRTAFEAWNEVDVAAELGRRTGLEVFIENDGTAAAVGELFGGRGRAVDDFLYVFIGPATGGGVVLGGDYLRGVAGNAGDLGLMPTTRSRLASVPAPRGSFEILLSRASTTALLRHLRSAGIALASADELATVPATLPAVTEWLDDCAEALVLPLLSAVRVLDVQQVVIDGGLPRPLLDRLLRRLAEALEAAAPEGRGAPGLLLGEVGEEAAAFGAAILPLHMNFTPNRDVLVAA